MSAIGSGSCKIVASGPIDLGSPPNPADRRGSLVRLTDTGRAVIDKAMKQHVATEHALVSGLDEHERAQLTGLLRKPLRAVDTR
jgi:DNA-binding MarR family transcriptional regulator